MSTRYENDFLSLKLEQLPKSRVKLFCEVKSTLTLPLRQTAIEKVETPVDNVSSNKKSVSVSSDELIQQKWKELIILKTLEEALKLSSVAPVKVGRVEIDAFEINHEYGCSMALEMDVIPKIPRINYARLKMPKIKKRKITADDIQLAIERLRYQHAVWLDLPKKPIEEGDFIVLEVIDLVAQKKIVDQQTYEVRPDVIAPWIYSNLLGKEVNDSFEANSQIDFRAPDHIKAAFVSHPCKVTICGVKKVILPELNSEFKLKVGVQTIDELKEKIKKQLEIQAEQEYLGNVEAELAEQLSNAYPFELPVSLVENQKTAIMQQVAEQPQTAQHEEMLNLHAEKSARVHLLLSQIASEEKIQINSTEIFSILDQNLPPQARHVLYDSKLQQQKEQLMLDVANTLMCKKAFQLVLSKLQTKAKEAQPILV